MALHPPRQEQTQIATYLDHKTQTIDKIASNIQPQITSLKELCKTLINDVILTRWNSFGLDKGRFMDGIKMVGYDHSGNVYSTV